MLNLLLKNRDLHLVKLSKCMLFYESKNRVIKTDKILK